MFVSFPEHEFRVPVQLGIPGCRHWRALGMSLCSGWFALTTRARHGEQLQSTMLFAWDTDVVDALKVQDFDVESLILFYPLSEGAARGFSSVAVREVWEATSEGDPEERCILFIDARGGSRSGPFLEATSRPIKAELIASI